MIRYGQVRNNEIVRIHSLVTDDAVLVPKLIKHDYRIIEEQDIPVHDQVTQLITSSYKILDDKILKLWTVTERAFTESKVVKNSVVESEAINSIRKILYASDKKTKAINILDKRDMLVSAINLANNNSDLRAIVVEYPAR